MRLFGVIAALFLVTLLGGCRFVVLDPSGDIAVQQRDLILVATFLMLLVVLPVMALTVLFAWRYRATNTAARYEPDWDHSMRLELVIWSAPLLIVIFLGAVTWMGTHLLDPYRPLDRISAATVASDEHRPLTVEVVALDWKWLFIYPDHGIATINELAAPVDRPIDFRITASSVMNSFYVPALAGQIYAMPGMETRLHAVINAEGTYEGFSANYSGAGFSQMRFAFLGLSEDGFDEWVAAAKTAGGTLGRDDYLALERPSQNVPAGRYGGVAPDLYDRILNMCVAPGKMCLDEMMAIDAKGGLGLAGIPIVQPLAYDRHFRRGTVFGPEPTYVTSLCTVDAPRGVAARPADAGPLSASPPGPLRGAGLPPPSSPWVNAPLLAPARAAPSSPAPSRS